MTERRKAYLFIPVATSSNMTINQLNEITETKPTWRNSTYLNE